MNNEEKILDILALMQTEMKNQGAQLRREILESENRIMAHIESAIEPRFGLLAEGQRAILDSITPVSRIEELEEEVKLLKVAFLQMNTQLQDLKKAL